MKFYRITPKLFTRCRTTKQALPRQTDSDVVINTLRRADLYKADKERHLHDIISYT